MLDSLQFLLIFCLVGVSLYLIYPLLEEKIVSRLITYVDDCQKISYKMFEELEKKTIYRIIGLTTGLFALAGFLLTRGQGWVQGLFTIGFGLVGFNVLKIFLTIKWKRRITKFNEQLVDGLSLLANSLKSGLNMSQAIQVLIREMSHPISQEFGTVMSQEKLGRTIDEALENMIERIPSEDLAIAIHSILILRETGGDLSETFETIANTVRERRKIEGKIQAMTAQGKTQGAMLMAMPFGLMIVLYFFNPGYLSPLINTKIGWLMILVMILFQAVGFFIMKKIIEIDV